MMQPLRKPSAPAREVIFKTQKTSAARVADTASGMTPSPALALQDHLATNWNAAATVDEERRWAPRSTLLLAAGVSLVIWGAIAGAAAGIL
jgi:hypothetical protein